MTQSRNHRPITTLGQGLTEMYRRHSPRVLVSSIVLLAFIRICWGHWTVWHPVLIAALLPLGPPVEYYFHRNYLHYRPRTIRFWGRAWQLPDLAGAQSHRLHHADPDNPQDIFIPDCIMRWIPCGVIGGCLAVFGPTLGIGYALTAALTILTRVLSYETLHYLGGHCPHYVPKRRGLWRWIILSVRKRHRPHHLVNEHYHMQVASFPWWDEMAERIARRRGRLGAKIPKSGTARNLGVIIDRQGAIID